MQKHFVEHPNENSIAGIFYKSWLRVPLFSISPKLTMRETFKNGWGVTTSSLIEKSELLECSKGLNLKIRDQSQKDPILHKYLWKNPIGDYPACHCDECKKMGHLFYLFGGFINFYNKTASREEANATFVVIENAHEKLVWSNDYPPTPCHLGVLYAHKEIKPNEEVLVYYGDRYDLENKDHIKTPFLDSKITINPPNIKFYEKDGPQGDGTTNIIKGYSPEEAKENIKKFKNATNDGSVPEDIDIEKLLKGESKK